MANDSSRLVLRCALAAAVFATAGLPGRSTPGQQPAAGRREVGKNSDSRQVASNLRRDWLRKQLPKLVHDPDELARQLDRVATASDDEVNEMANDCLAELAARRERQFDQLRAANARERALRGGQPRAAEQSPADASAIPAGAPAGYFPFLGFIPSVGYVPSLGYNPGLAYYTTYYSAYYPGLGYYPGFGCFPGVAYAPLVGWFPDGVGLSAYGVVGADRRSVRLSLFPHFSAVGPVHTFNYRTGNHWTGNHWTGNYWMGNHWTGETRHLRQHGPLRPPSITPPVTLPDLSGR